MVTTLNRTCGFCHNSELCKYKEEMEAFLAQMIEQAGKTAPPYAQVFYGCEHWIQKPENIISYRSPEEVRKPYGTSGDPPDDCRISTRLIEQAKQKEHP